MINNISICKYYIDNCQMETVWIVIVVTVVVFLVFMCSSKKEHYGPIKNITRIPTNNCKDICLQHYRREMAEFGHLNADWIAKKYHSCINVCNHTNHFRT